MRADRARGSVSRALHSTLLRRVVDFARRFERKLARQAALDTPRRLAGELRSRQSIFASPPSLSFSPDASSPSPSSSTPSTPPLTFDKPNRAFLGHEEFLVSLLSEVDGVSSGGDKVVKRERKRLVKRIERELSKLDELREREWERQSQRRASEAGDATQDKVVEAAAQVVPAAPVDTAVPSTTVPDPAPLDQATTARPLAGESAMVSSDNSTGEAGNEASTLDVKPRPDTSAATCVESNEAHEPAPQPVHSPTESDVPEPAPLTADSLAALSASTSTSARLARRPSRASTTSVESETSPVVDGYVQEVLRRARDLGERVEWEEQEEVEGKAAEERAGFAAEDGRGAGAEDGSETADTGARGETGEDE
ncbi:hypothetical protein DMC30DRAFT_446649 [Rhodotorula diobovata]|uniref:BAG domain-containing protein n=1 Tax=Rhodotorula diobovata TaxID=5288 RepID=A0A5C5FXX9_9BASI|nr:hypothetical protein DMC30DRAFT_446649 [Rhodotorula diobovata]